MCGSGRRAAPEHMGLGVGSVSVRRRLSGEFASRTTASGWKPQITWAPGRAGIFREDTVTDPISLTKVPSAVGRPTMKFITANPRTTRRKGSRAGRTARAASLLAPPLCMTTMRPAMSWLRSDRGVTWMQVVPSRRCKSRISPRIWTRSLASRFERGSSKRKTFGSRTIVRPIATRCLWPPESCPDVEREVH